jgi:hypothetical protein
MRRLLPLWTLLACQAPIDVGTSQPSQRGLAATGTHPFKQLGTLHPNATGHQFDNFAVLDTEYAASMGEQGLRVIGLDDAADLFQYEEDDAEDRLSGTVLSHDPTTQTLWAGLTTDLGILDGVARFDISTPTHPVLLSTHMESRDVEAISADDGLVLIGTSTDAHLLDTEATLLSSISLPGSFGAALMGNRALIASDSELLLFDVSDPTQPTELDRLPLVSRGWVVAYDGERIAVVLGSAGVGLYRADEDQLEKTGHISLPSSTFDVAFDGDALWIAAFTGAWLVDVHGPNPVILGESPSTSHAIGIGAGYGRAVVGELEYARVLGGIPSGGGPEISITETLLFPEGGPVSQEIRIRNDGKFSGVVKFDCDGCTVSDRRIELPPASQTTVDVTAETPSEASLRWWTNDPDEPRGNVTLAVADPVVGNPHPDFSSEVFKWPGDTLFPVDQTVMLGKVTFLNFFKDT